MWGEDKLIKNRKVKGVASIVEAMLISIAIAALVAMSFTFFMNSMQYAEPDIHYVNLQSQLCGKVFSIENIGNYPVKINALIEIGTNSQGQIYSLTRTLNIVLYPKEYKQYTLDNNYNYVYIIAGNYRSKPISNNCAWIQSSS